MILIGDVSLSPFSRKCLFEN